MSQIQAVQEAVILGPYSFLQDNPRLGFEPFSVPSVIFFVHVYTRYVSNSPPPKDFALVVRPHTQQVCFNMRTRGSALQAALDGRAQDLK